MSMGRWKWVLLFSKPFLYSTLKAPKHTVLLEACLGGSDVKTNTREKPRLPGGIGTLGNATRLSKGWDSSPGSLRCWHLGTEVLHYFVSTRNASWLFSSSCSRKKTLDPWFLWKLWEANIANFGLQGQPSLSLNLIWTLPARWPLGSHITSLKAHFPWRAIVKSKQNSSWNPLGAGMVNCKHLINVGNEGANEDGWWWWCDGGDDGVMVRKCGTAEET